MNTNNLRFSIISFFTFTLIFKVLIFQPSVTFTQSRCENCYRAAVIDEVDTNAGDVVERSILGLIAEAFISHCFHIQCPIEVIPEEFRYMVRTKPPEYLFRASFYEKLPGDITSRMEIRLYYNGKTEELVKSWPTEHDSKIVYYRAHRNKWFYRGEKLIARKIRPIELTVLNDFEKRPWKCDISLEKDEICPGDEISVLLTNIQDIAGKQSREFNRVVV